MEWTSQETEALLDYQYGSWIKRDQPIKLLKSARDYSQTHPAFFAAVSRTLLQVQTVDQNKAIYSNPFMSIVEELPAGRPFPG